MRSFRCCTQASRMTTRCIVRVGLKGAVPYRHGVIQVKSNSNHQRCSKPNNIIPFTLSNGNTRRSSASTVTHVEGKQAMLVSITQHLVEMLTNSGYKQDKGIDTKVKKSVARILTPENNIYLHDDATAKITRDIANFRQSYSSQNFTCIPELSLQLALVQSKSNILGPSLQGPIEAYSLGYSPDVSRLISDCDDWGQKLETDTSKYCVYVHTWINLPVENLAPIFESQEIKKQSKKATSLVKHVANFHNNQRSTTINLAYVGLKK